MACISHGDSSSEQKAGIGCPGLSSQEVSSEVVRAADREGISHIFPAFFATGKCHRFGADPVLFTIVFLESSTVLGAQLLFNK